MAPSHISWHQARRTESAAYPFFPPQSSSSSSSFTSSGYVTSTSPSNLLQQLRALLWVYPDLARELLPFPFCAGRIPGSPGLLLVQKWAQSQKNQANTRQKAPPWCRTKSVTISMGGDECPPHPLMELKTNSMTAHFPATHARGSLLWDSGQMLNVGKEKHISLHF